MNFDESNDRKMSFSEIIQVAAGLAIRDEKKNYEALDKLGSEFGIALTPAINHLVSGIKSVFKALNCLNTPLEDGDNRSIVAVDMLNLPKVKVEDDEHKAGYEDHLVCLENIVYDLAQQLNSIQKENQ